MSLQYLNYRLLIELHKCRCSCLQSAIFEFICCTLRVMGSCQVRFKANKTVAGKVCNLFALKGEKIKYSEI